jgi:DNA adenine methylase
MFTRADFARMADQLAGIKGRFLLSINDVPEIRALFCQFEIEEVKVSYTIGDTADRSPTRSELLIRMP